MDVDENHINTSASRTESTLYGATHYAKPLHLWKKIKRGTWMK